MHLLNFKKFINPVDFVFLDREVDISIPIIRFGPFLATVGTYIDTKHGKLQFQVGEKR